MKEGFTKQRCPKCGGKSLCTETYMAGMSSVSSAAVFGTLIALLNREARSA